MLKARPFEVKLVLSPFCLAQLLFFHFSMRRHPVLKAPRRKPLSKVWTHVMPILSLALVLALLTALSACGKKSESFPASTSTFAYATSTEALNAVKTWKVSCEDAQNCPDNVGQLLIKDDNNVTVCTASLVDTDTILTNSHCLKSAQGAQTDFQKLCQEGISLRFPDNSKSGAQTAHCASVIIKSSLQEGQTNHPDFALLKLTEPLTRTPIQVSRAGLSDQTPVQIFKVDPVAAGRGTLKVASCQIALSTYLLPGLTTPDMPIEVMKGCHVWYGNSGAPIADASGNLLGILHAGFESHQDDQVTQLSQKNVSYVTSAACIDFAFKNTSPIAAKCTDPATQTALDQTFDTTAEKQKILDEVMSQISAHSLPTEKTLGYQLLTLKNFQVLEYRPFCILNESAVPGAGRDVEVTANEIVWKVKRVVSDSLQLTYQASPAQKIPVRLSLSPTGLKKCL
jgi:hypothetical protein